MSGGPSLPISRWKGCPVEDGGGRLLEGILGAGRWGPRLALRLWMRSAFEHGDS